MLNNVNFTDDFKAAIALIVVAFLAFMGEINTLEIQLEGIKPNDQICWTADSCLKVDTTKNYNSVTLN